MFSVRKFIPTSCVGSWSPAQQMSYCSQRLLFGSPGIRDFNELRGFFSSAMVFFDRSSLTRERNVTIAMFSSCYGFSSTVLLSALSSSFSLSLFSSGVNFHPRRVSRFRARNGNEGIPGNVHKINKQIRVECWSGYGDDCRVVERSFTSFLCFLFSTFSTFRYIHLPDITFQRKNMEINLYMAIKRTVDFSCLDVLQRRLTVFAS